MQDPFADQSNNRLQREVQVWMAGLACLLIAFMYLAVKRMAGPNNEIPPHILQSGVAHVTAPIEHDPDSPQLLNPPKLPSAPPIPSAGFSAKSLSSPKQRTQPGFSLPNRRKPRAAVTNTPKPMLPKSLIPKQGDVPQPKRNEHFAFPKPKFVATPDSKNTPAAIDADAEALGRRRAKQLAAMTSGLPNRLNQIQSSIKQASAELPTESSTTQEEKPAESNSFVPVKSFPAQTVTLNPNVVTPNRLQPTIESSHPVKPVDTQSLSESFSIKPAFKPVPQPGAQSSARPSAIPRPSDIARPKEIEPAKVTATTNSFQPLHAARPSTIVNSLPTRKPLPASETVATRATRTPEPLRPAASKTQTSNPVGRSPAAPDVEAAYRQSRRKLFHDRSAALRRRAVVPCTSLGQSNGDCQPRWFASWNVVINSDDRRAGSTVSRSSLSDCRSAAF